MEPFKNIYSKKSISQLAQIVQSHCPEFSATQFKKSAAGNIDALEMKDRVRQIAAALHSHLPGDFKQQTSVLVKTLSNEADHEPSEWQGGDLRNAGTRGFMVWPLTQFVETYGTNDLDISMKALYEMTKRFTAEFAIRPFIEKYPKEVYAHLTTWSKDPNHHVRRLVSEGTRPNLPWGLKVHWINKNLTKNIRLLNSLKTDDSEYVRRSVANHINDITRIDPELALKTLEHWNKKADAKTKGITKHALRSLLKAGDPRALKMMGFNPLVKTEVTAFKLDSKKIKDGDFIIASLKIKNPSKKPQALMIDYIVSYKKKSGALSDKVFKWKTLNLAPGEVHEASKKISFKKVTTRRHYPGKHLISLQVNGKKLKQSSFELIG